MTGFYGEMAEMAGELLAEFAQGSVSLKRVTTVPGENPWDEPTETTVTYALSATVKRVNQRFDRGTLIQETGDVISFAPIEVEPKLTDTLIVDGSERAITDLKRIPAAGTVVMWQAFVAA